jgi:nucleoside-diphosphate-sugar epimerase
MDVVITGGLGFLGTILTEKLLQRGHLVVDGRPQAIDEIVLLDNSARDLTPPERARIVVGDIRDPSVLQDALSERTASIFHLASIVSAEAEERWDDAVDTNIYGLVSLLRACRGLSRRPRLVFASSLAATSRRTGDDRAAPNSTYGMTKAVCELLLEDATRVGTVDARVARLPTVIIRPGSANRAASGFASALFREPHHRRPVTIPVRANVELLVIGATTAVECVISLHDLDPARLDDSRVVNLPGLTVSVEQMLSALENHFGAGALEYIDFDVDPSTERIVSGWPTHWNDTRARALGLPHDASLTQIVQEFVDRS